MALKIISVALDEETWIRLQHALHAATVAAGVEQVTVSIWLRQLIRQALEVDYVPFDSGWQEGYRAAVRAVMLALPAGVRETVELAGLDHEQIKRLG